MSDRYDAVISRKDKDGKWRSTRIGAGFPKEGRINIVLDALPMPNAEGQAWITLFPAKEKRDEPATRQAADDDEGDSIPF